MADPERSTPMTVTLEGTDANSGVRTFCLEGRVAAQTELTWCVAIPGATTTTTDRNAHTYAETRRSVQTTTLGYNLAATEDRGGELDSLRLLRNHARSNFKAILAHVQRICTPLPAVCKLNTCLENLKLKQACLKKLDAAIIDLVDKELEEEVETAELYIDCFIRARVLLNHYIDSRKKRVPPELKGPDRRLEELIARLKDCSADPCTRVSDVNQTDVRSALPNEPTEQQPAKGNDETSSTVKHAQTAIAGVGVARAPEEARVEPPPSEFEFLFVPDFMKEEALPELLETARTHANNYPASSEFQEGLLDSAGPGNATSLKPADGVIATSVKGSSRTKCRRPGTPRHSNVSCMVTAWKSNWKSATWTRNPVNRRYGRFLLMKRTHPTRRQRSDLGTPFKSSLGSSRKTYRNNKTWRVARHCLWYDRHMTTEGMETFPEARHTVWLPSASTWRRLVIRKSARRWKHRWKRKRRQNQKAACKD